MDIVRLGPDTEPSFATLVPLADAEGFRFLSRAVAEWSDGSNRFDRPGESLVVARVGPETVGVAGINVDPFLGDTAVGRLRRVYVAPPQRGYGVGRRLVVSCLEAAADHFSRVRLRTENPVAARLYESVGFIAVDEPDATHSWITVRL